MTLTLHLNVWTYSIGAFVLGLILMLTDKESGGWPIAVPSLRLMLALLLWLSIPFVWLGHWLR